MKKILYVLLSVALFTACKKSEDSAPSPLYVDFTTTGNTGVTTLPKSMTFTANIPDSADVVTWDFGDSTTATGFKVNHTYSRYGTYNIKISAVNGSRTGERTRRIPFTIYRKFQINVVDILETDPYTSNGFYWDSGNDKPDLTTEITYPGFVYRSGIVLNNVDSGTINIIPPVSTAVLDGAIKIEIYDVDTNLVPDRKIMNYFDFNITDYVLPTLPYPVSAEFVKGRTRLKVVMSWVP